MQISQILKTAVQQLAPNSDSPRLDAEILLAHSLQKNRTWLITWSDKEPDELALLAFYQLLDRRLKGEPIAHIIGSREFWSLPLKVSKDTLIPRPETELLVENILDAYPQTPDIRLLDLGTGSGAIALALASERPNWQITATDKSAAALNIAQQNAQQLNLKNINFICADWFSAFENPHAKNQQFEIIASNPPYIPAADPHLSQGDLRFEPLSALTSGKDGLHDIHLICKQALSHLTSGGMLIIEHGFDQKEELLRIFTNSAYKNIRQAADLSHQPRLTIGFKP